MTNIGSNFLIPRNSHAEIEIETLERNLLFKIPPLYREFLLRFKQGEDGLNLEKYFRKDINYYDIIGPAIYSKNLQREIILDHFYESDEIL